MFSQGKVIGSQPGNIPLDCKGSGNYSKASKSLSVSKRLPAYKVRLVLEDLQIYWVLFNLANLASHCELSWVGGELAHQIVLGIVTVTLKAVGLDNVL